MDNIWKEGQLLLCSRCCPIYLCIHPSNPLDLPSLLILILTIIPTMEWWWWWWWWCRTGSAYKTTLLGTTASTSGDTYLFMRLTFFRYFFFPIPLHSYTTLVLRIFLWEEEVMISSGRLTRPCWRLPFKSLASRMCWYLILLLILLSGDENWLCPMRHHSWYQIDRQGVTLRRRRRHSCCLLLLMMLLFRLGNKGERSGNG